MSLIYNSLKQHEKKPGLQSLADLTSQTIQQNESDANSLSLVWWGLLGFFFATVVGFFSLQSYWAFQAKDESLSNVNQVGLESIQLDFDKQPEIMFAQNNQVDDADLQHSVKINPGPITNELKSTTYTDILLTMNSVKKMEPIPRSSDKTIFEPMAERQAFDSQDLNQVQAPILKVEKEVQPIPIEAFKTVKGQLKTVVLMPFDKAIAVQIEPKQIVGKREVTKSKPRRVEVKESNETVIDVKTIHATRASEAIKTSSKVQEVIAIKSPHIERNSADYFMAVKNKVISIKQALNFKSFKEADVRLNQLETLSGPESVIFQRMQAYVALKNSNYQDAMMGYKKLLNQKPDDLEANMNLVIVLSELGEKQTAKQQLHRLDNMYPESEQVRLYKKMIKAKYGY